VNCVSSEVLRCADCSLMVCLLLGAAFGLHRGRRRAVAELIGKGGPAAPACQGPSSAAGTTAMPSERR
jgi:hypothetical protein